MIKFQIYMNNVQLKIEKKIKYKRQTKIILPDSSHYMEIQDHIMSGKCDIFFEYIPVIIPTEYSSSYGWSHHLWLEI